MGPLGDLKRLIYELYLAAGTPTLDSIAAWVAADDQLVGAPERDTVRRIIRDPDIPPSQGDVVALVTVLARVARWDPVHVVAQARSLWIAARMAPEVGRALNDALDPYELEIHHPITVSSSNQLPPLTTYVRRAHDQQLAEVVADVMAGRSRIAILVSGSSTGKTRACWEALRPLRLAGDWRIWHPYSPTRVEALTQGIDQVTPRTVLWLNELQEYLAAPDGRGERAAASLRYLLTDVSRAPVLIVGTLWPSHFESLPGGPASQPRQLLDSAIIDFQDSFDNVASALTEAVTVDPRWKWALNHADDNQITQCLAGGPELIKQFRTARPGAKALILAAMDLRRFGHRNAMPLPLLEQSAISHLTDAHLDELGTEWLTDGLLEVSRPAKGARGAITILRDRKKLLTRPLQTRETDGPILYQLADYLDQYGREYRKGVGPPKGFWGAAAMYSNVGDLIRIGTAAWLRGYYRDAAQAWKNAAWCGDTNAMCALISHLDAIHPGDSSAIEWVVNQPGIFDPERFSRLLSSTRKSPALTAIFAGLDPAGMVELSDPRAVASLLIEMLRSGLSAQSKRLLGRNIMASVELEDPAGLVRLLTAMHEAGAASPIADMVRRDPAAHIRLDDAHGVAGMLQALREANQVNQVESLIARNPAQNVRIDDAVGVSDLLAEFRIIGAIEQISLLVGRSPADFVDMGFAGAVIGLLFEFARIGATEQIRILLGRAPANVNFRNQFSVSALLEVLDAAGGRQNVDALVGRDPARSANVYDPVDIAWRLDVFTAVAATDQIEILIERDFANLATLEDPGGVARLLNALKGAGLTKQVDSLLRRNPASQIMLEDTHGVSDLLLELRSAKAVNQIQIILDRDPARFIRIDNAGDLVRFFDVMRLIGAPGHIEALACRNIGQEVQLDDPVSRIPFGIHRRTGVLPLEVQWLISRLIEIDAVDQASTLIQRLPAAGLFDVFVENDDKYGRDRFRFGIEYELDPAEPWSWQDLY